MPAAGASFPETIIMKLLYVLVIALGPFTIRAQQPQQPGTRQDTLVYLQHIIKNQGMLTSERVGFAGSPSRSWYSLILLSGIATQNELTVMTRDKNPVVRISAFLALNISNGRIAPSVNRRILKDKAVVRTLTGCLASDMTVAAIAKNPTRWYDADAASAMVSNIKNVRKFRKDIFEQLTSATAK
jgi:hypothetical protein